MSDAPYSDEVAQHWQADRAALKRLAAENAELRKALEWSASQMSRDSGCGVVCGRTDDHSHPISEHGHD